jgi:hypothetical protein
MAHLLFGHGRAGALRLKPNVKRVQRCVMNYIPDWQQNELLN